MFSEHRAETPDTSALNLPMTSQRADRSDTRTDVCVSGVYTSEECVTRPERHSPAGSSRPGSARHTHPAHSRPRTSGRTPGQASELVKGVTMLLIRVYIFHFKLSYYI